MSELPRQDELAPKHDFQCIGGGAGMELWKCSRCYREAWPNVLGFLWPELARYVPFCGRWRCRPRRST